MMWTRSTLREQQEEVLAPLLETKLHPPRLSALLVERAHLLALLDRGRQQKLTLLQAPAGFGKTTLVTQWIVSLQTRAMAAQQRPESVAWLSLDSGDNDPIRFWSSLIISCQTFQPQIGQTALTHLSQIAYQPFSASSLETVLTLLLNDLGRSGLDGVLVLEEYHHIEQARIHETLAFFIEHLPASFHMMILTRVEPPLPLVRWRARGDLLEIVSNHLRFSAEETAHFLHQIIPQITSEEAIHRLSTDLEGWPAGLRLLALSLQGHMTERVIENALKQLHAGSVVNLSHRSIQEYFLHEVLNAQPEPLQLFLLQTSLLSRLSASLCDAVTGREDSAARLAQVERSGFFLEALESTEEWYRYHALFAEIMRGEAKRRLGEEALRRLLAEASRWYAEHGLLVEAVEAALSAQEFESAASFIEALHEMTYFSEYHTLRRWLEQLPVSMLRAHPELCFRYAQAQLFPEDMSEAATKLSRVEDLLQMAEAGWRSQGDLPHVGMLYAFRATYMCLGGDFTLAVPYARQALQLLPAAAEPLDAHIHGRHDWRCICLLALGMEMMHQGTFDKAREMLLDAYMLSLNERDRVFAPIVEGLLGDVCFELGELHQASSYYQQALASNNMQGEPGEDFLRASSLYRLARLSYEWNELERVEQLLNDAPSSFSGGPFPLAEKEAYVRKELVRLRLLHAHGEMAEALSALSALVVRLGSTPGARSYLPDVLILQVRLQLYDDNVTGASHTLDTIARFGQELSFLQHRLLRLLRARLSLAQGQAEVALRELSQLLVFAQEGKHLICTLEIQLLIALVHVALKQGQQARQQLLSALSQARSEGFVRLFLNEGEPLATLLRQLLPDVTQKSLRTYIQSLLQAFPASLLAHSTGHSATESPLLEPLSTQEQRVLTLLVAGRSNPEIAETLIISINTVKGHVKNLYRKLDVSNRMEAAEVARRYKLI